MKVVLIAAIDNRNGIGKNGQLAWKNSEDLQHFKDYTNGKVIAMGRKTWDSLPIKPLPNRYNIVVSSDCDFTKNLDVNSWPDSISKTCGSVFGEAFDLNADELCIIGGQDIYQNFMPYATNLVITRIKGDYQCDRFFPEIDVTWALVRTEQKKTCAIEYYERLPKNEN